MGMKSARIPKCFDDANAFTWLTQEDDFGVLPITEADYAWLMNNIPIKHETREPIRTYGEVVADRVCMYFDGLYTRDTLGQRTQCNNGCGKWCEQGVVPAAARKWQGANPVSPSTR